MLGQLGELYLYKMWAMYLQLVSRVNARPKNSSSLALCSLFFSAMSSLGSSFSYWNLLSIYPINLSPFSSTRVSHCLQVGHPQTTAHIKRTPVEWRLRPGLCMEWPGLTFYFCLLGWMWWWKWVALPHEAQVIELKWEDQSNLHFITEHLCSYNVLLSWSLVGLLGSLSGLNLCLQYTWGLFSLDDLVVWGLGSCAALPTTLWV